MMKTLLGFGDLALIFEVTAELNRSNLSICGGEISVFSENNTSFRIAISKILSEIPLIRVTNSLDNRSDRIF